MADSLFLFVVRFFAGEYCTISIFFSIIETAALDSAPLVLTAASAYDGSSSCRTKNTFQHYSCQQILLSSLLRSKASRYLYLFHFLGLLSSLYLLTSLKNTHTEARLMIWLRSPYRSIFKINKIKTNSSNPETLKQNYLYPPYFNWLPQTTRTFQFKSPVTLYTAKRCHLNGYNLTTIEWMGLSFFVAHTNYLPTW